jgi:hypothetical protein
MKVDQKALVLEIFEKGFVLVEKFPYSRESFDLIIDTFSYSAIMYAKYLTDELIIPFVIPIPSPMVPNSGTAPIIQPCRLMHHPDQSMMTTTWKLMIPLIHQCEDL